jgi:2-polyprenyl-6-methoxyphenol hydroxylase-like FAD-dependent oxidoreductase
MESWSDITLDLCNEIVRIDGVGFSAIGRLELLRLLRLRAQGESVEIEYEQAIHGTSELGTADLIVGADGANSIVRRMNEAAFGTTLTLLTNKFAWFGTGEPFDTLTQTFRRNADGCFNAHHYRYSPTMSTFIVEADQETWRRARFAEMSLSATEKYLEKVFEDVLQGHALISNRSVWRNFPKIANAHWSVGNTVLVGDALHTAHFSIGSGTRLAMEDAIALVAALDRNWPDVRGGLAAYETSRRPVAEKITSAACASAAWYEHFGEHMDLPPADFAISYLNRSGRLDREKLSRMAPKFMAAYLRRTSPPRRPG